MKLTEILFPRKCVLCDELSVQRIFDKTSGKERYLCDECRKKFRVIKEPRCKKCGRQIHDESEEYCINCRDKKYQFESGRGVITYEGAVKNMMYRFKYSGMRWYKEFFSDVIEESAGEWIEKKNFDLVIPVPLHVKKYRKRGYNQAALIAKEISKKYNITYSEKAVKRAVMTTPQKELGYEERKNNLKNAFIIDDNSVLLDCRRILVVDDIFTTGATVDSVARIIRESTDAQIYFLSVCIGADY